MLQIATGDFIGLDYLRKPRQLKAMPSFIEKLTVTLTPSLEKLEEEMCRQLNEDRINRENKVADGTVVSIVERRLQVGLRESCIVLFGGMLFGGMPSFYQVNI